MICLEKNIREAERALTEKPIFSTSVERVLLSEELRNAYDGLPQPKRYAGYVRDLLSRVSVPLEDYDLIAGRCVDRELNEEEEAIYQRQLKDQHSLRKTTMISSGHCTYSWAFLVEEGLVGLRRIASERLACAEDGEQRIFLESLIECYDAIAAYLLRYARAAEARGIHELAASLRKAATERPADFRTALQLLWTVTLIDCAYLTPNPTLTLGRLDQILLPLYRADLASGRLTEEEARALITDYYCKHNLIMGRGEHQLGNASDSTTFDRIYNFDAPQYLLLAGTDVNGGSAVNELTRLFVEELRPNFKNPVALIRYYPGMASEHPDVWSRLSELALAGASMMFYNDDNIIRAYRRMGIPEEDSRRYEHFGCNWPSLGDNSTWMSSGASAVRLGACVSEEEEKLLRVPFIRTRSAHSWPEDVVELLNELALRERQGLEVSIDRMYDGLLERFGEYLDRKLSVTNRELSVRKRKPSGAMNFGDCFYRDAVESGTTHSVAAKYHFCFASFQMFGTVIDSLITIERLVFIDRVTTLTRLSEAVAADFVGYEDLLALCRRVEKYGSDTPHSNACVERLGRGFCDMIREKNARYIREGGVFLTPSIQSDTWHIKYGITYGATPDGRRSGTPFSQNMRPSNGACINGIPAMLNSMLHLPSDGLVSGSLNLDVDPEQFAGEAGRARFGALLSSYFDRGGLQAQVSSGNAELLREAQRDPDSHGDLRVRVTGYSGVFVDIGKTLQDDIIRRFE